MRKNMLSFVSGAIVTLLLVSMSVTALAANGAMKIEVSPIKVMVNGEVFQPKDANGNDVMVFVHNGTTYAPLRALAEAYGLDVGYDAENRMATVNAGSAVGNVTPSGSNSNHSNSDFIGEEQARSIALEKVPGANANHVRKMKLEYDDGRWEYEVEIYCDGVEYEGEIDARTGEVLKWEAERD